MPPAMTLTALPIGSFTGQADYTALTPEPFSVGRPAESTAEGKRGGKRGHH